MQKGRKAALLAMAALTMVSLASCRKAGDGDGGGGTGTGTAAENAFRNAVGTPPPNSGRVFELAKDFPTTAPAECTECTWLKMPVNFGTTFPAPKQGSDAWTKGGWAEYIAAILAYVKKGQDPNLDDKLGWITSVGGESRWFNVPWMAYDPTVGREYRHGTTNERTAELEDLIGPDGKPLPDDFDSIGATHFLMISPKQAVNCPGYKEGFETWSVGYYNPQGGYAIGQAIPKTGVPATAEYMGKMVPAGLPFPTGTVVMKVLTTNAPVECVPFLQGSPQWTINRHKKDADDEYVCERADQPAHVVQIDVAVTDPRSPSGWVYGTYAYNGQQQGATFWDRLTPLGLQWGMDPWTFPAVPEADSQPLQQSVANPAVTGPNPTIYEHMGCRGRLAGPVDNPQSSCMSCHGSAFAAKPGVPTVMGTNVPPSFGFPALCQSPSAQNSDYFQTIKFPQPYAGGGFPDTLPLDTSLQLEVAYQQYAQFKTAGEPVKCKGPNK